MTPTLIDVAETWTRIEQVLQKHVPDTARTLARPATDDDIAELQAAIGLILPTDFCQSLKVHNGQEDSTRCHSFIIEGLLASTSQISETWRMLTEVDDRFRQELADWVQGDWWSRHWVPFTIGDGDCLCINLDPNVRPGGTLGEIVCHVHDNPHEDGIAVSYGAWLQLLADRLENGEFTIDQYGYLAPNIP
jgi:cell wall assembly regulator SMI1